MDIPKETGDPYNQSVRALPSWNLTLALSFFGNQMFVLGCNSEHEYAYNVED